MTNGQIGTPNEITIEATVDVDAGWVRLDPPRALVPAGSAVLWSFTGLREGQRPALRFLSFTPRADERPGLLDPSLGPFRSLVRRGSEIRGSEKHAAKGEYSYKVCLVSADGANALVRQLECRGAPAGGLVDDPGPARGGGA